MHAPIYTFIVTSAALHLLQATLFGLVIAGLLLALPRLSPGLRQFLEWAGLVKFVLPLSLVGLNLPLGRDGLWPTFAILSHSAGTAAVTSGREASWIAWSLVAIWGGGVLLCGGSTLIRMSLLARRLRRTSSPFPEALQRRLVVLARTAGVNPARVKGRMIDDSLPPCVAGIFRSSINVPRELLQSLAPDEVEAVLLHELVHIARRDNLWRLLQVGLVMPFWFHPLVWWLHRHFLLDGERACDERVARLAPSREAYVSGLIKAARSALGLGVPGFSGMAGYSLKQRCAAILNQPKRKDHPMLRFTLIGLALAGFLATAGAAAPAADSGTFAINQLDVPPEVVSQAHPVYPPNLARAKVTGQAVLEYVIDTQGKVSNATVISATQPEFGVSAAAAVLRWTYTPGERGGRAVNTRVHQAIVFGLG